MVDRIFRSSELNLRIVKLPERNKNFYPSNVAISLFYSKAANARHRSSILHVCNKKWLNGEHYPNPPLSTNILFAVKIGVRHVAPVNIFRLVTEFFGKVNQSADFISFVLKLVISLKRIPLSFAIFGVIAGIVAASLVEVIKAEAVAFENHADSAPLIAR